MQFLPFCLASPPAYEGLLVGEPVTASFLGVLRDNNGKVILDGVYLRTRAECAGAIMRAVANGRGSPNGGAWLDMTANKRAPLSGPYFQRFLETCLPSAFTNARQALGKKAAACEEPWEVRPSAHYAMGGIRADANGASVGGAGDGVTAEGISGLFAAGQAMGGVFGANRLGSTSLTEGAVFGTRSGQAAAAMAKSAPSSGDDAAFQSLIDAVQARFGQPGTVAAATLKLELQEKAWEDIGPIRTAESLDRMDALIDRLTAQLDQVAVPAYGMWNQSFLEFEELRNLLDTARAVTAAARERDGSLGGHVRLDRKNISALSQPYSTVVRRIGETWQVDRLERRRTPMKRLLSYKYQDTKRKLQAKLLRLMPKGMQDRKLLARYQAIMGASSPRPGARARARLRQRRGRDRGEHESMKVEIVTLRDGAEAVVEFDYALRSEDEKPMALDVLLQAQATTMPDLAFRYGCRARNCGVCTIDINGLPRIACRARAREGDRLSPMATLPAVGDLVVRRDGIARQMRGRLQTAQGNDLNVDAPEAYHELTSCIECYACLNDCPMHLRNFGGKLPGDVPAEQQPDRPQATAGAIPFRCSSCR